MKVIWIIAAGLALLVASQVGNGNGSTARADGGGTARTTVVANPLTVTLSLSTHSIQRGRNFTARARVSNLGSGRLAGVVATLRLTPAAIRIHGPATRRIVTVRGNGASTLAWDLCGLTPGNYIAMVIVTASGVGGSFSAESAAELVTIRDGRSRC